MIPTFMSVISPTIRAMSDAELVAAMREGKGEALTALFARYARLVHRVAAQILRDHGEAEDSTQEIFFEIYRKAHLYDAERGPVRGWLLQYAYRRTLRRRSMLTRRAAYAGEPIENLDDIAQRPPSLSTEECRWVLRSALAQLPEMQRTTIELTCFEDLTLRDVAERLGVSVGCTRHYYYRGLARLQAWAAVTTPPRHRGCRTPSRGDRAGDARAATPRLPVHA